MQNSNWINVPQARKAMDRFKTLVCSEVGVNLQSGYNGQQISLEAGDLAGRMVKKILPIRNMQFERNNRIAVGHVQKVTYITMIAT